MQRTTARKKEKRKRNKKGERCGLALTTCTYITPTNVLETGVTRSEVVACDFGAGPVVHVVDPLCYGWVRLPDGLGDRWPGDSREDCRGSWRGQAMRRAAMEQVDDSPYHP